MIILTDKRRLKLTDIEFQTCLKESIAKVQEVLKTKAQEYAGDEDRLVAFKTAAILLNCTPEQALRGMVTKHIISIFDMLSRTNKLFSIAQWDEKIIDVINYMILLRALVKEGKLDIEPSQRTMCLENLEKRGQLIRRDDCKRSYSCSVCMDFHQQKSDNFDVEECED